MDFIAAPLRITTDGGMQRCGTASEAIIELLKIIAYTPTGGWVGGEQFGMRDKLASLQTKYAAKLAAVEQINQALLDLGIDWVRVDKIEVESNPDASLPPYVFTLSFPNQVTETVRLRGKNGLLPASKN